MRRGAIVRITGIGIVIAIICLLVAFLINWLPTSASEQMNRIEDVYWFATFICIGIFALVMSVLIYSVWKFRSPPEDESDGPSIHGHTGLEIIWTVVPAVLVIAIGIVSAVVLSQNGNAGTNPMTIKVFAQQFSWRFEYPDSKNLKSYELVMPVNRNITFEMQSADVIHSFWIPAMGQKQDVVPGIKTGIVITPTRTGNLHAHLHRALRARPRDDAVTGQGCLAGGLRCLGEGSAGIRERQRRRRGRVPVRRLRRLSRVHPGRDRRAAIGPDLDNVAADATKAGEDPAAYIRESIVDPNKVLAPGFAADVMPGNFKDSLSAKEIDALVTYLTETKQ